MPADPGAGGSGSSGHGCRGLSKRAFFQGRTPPWAFRIGDVASLAGHGNTVPLPRRSRGVRSYRCAGLCRAPQEGWACGGAPALRQLLPTWHLFLSFLPAARLGEGSSSSPNGLGSYPGLREALAAWVPASSVAEGEVISGKGAAEQME